MTAYYNEIDPFKAEVLREAIKAGAIAHGEVDERSIADVKPAELMGYTQCHFFAGGGFWSYALRQAGWTDDRPVWTGSSPCPSFSAAGKGAGFRDPRHLWPDWMGLIRECRPAIVFGEQVAAAIGHGWLDLVQTDLEAQGYAVGKAVFGAASVGAPHIRQRLYFVAESGECGWGEGITVYDARQLDDARSSNTSLVVNPALKRDRTWDGESRSSGRQEKPVGRSGFPVELEHPARRGCGERGDEAQPGRGGHADGAERAFRLGEPEDEGLQERELHTGSVRQTDGAPEGQGLERRGDAGGMADADGGEPGDGGVQRGGEHGQRTQDSGVGSVAHPLHAERRAVSLDGEDGRVGAHGGWPETCSVAGTCGEVRGVADTGRSPGDAKHIDESGQGLRRRETEDESLRVGPSVRAGKLDDTIGNRRRESWNDDGRNERNIADTEGVAQRPSPLNGFWRDADWIGGRDGKWRPVEPGTFPLAHGSAARVGRLRLYGDAICIPAAQAFIEAYLETESARRTR